MKSLFLITIILFTALTTTFAQDCKWAENKKDPISDTKYLKSKKNSGWIKGEKPSPGILPYFDSHIELKDGKVSFYIHFEITSVLSLEKIQNPKLIVKLADGNKIELSSDEQFAATIIPAQASYTTSDLRWEISKEDLKKLASSKFTAMRISFAGQDYSFVIEDKHAQEFLKMFDCMSKEM